MAYSRIINSLAGALIVVVAGSLMTGCSFMSKDSPMARRLSEHEASKLVATQGVRKANAKGEAVARMTPMQLEAEGDRQAMSGQFNSAVFRYSRALITVKDPAQKMRLQAKLAELYLRLGQFTQAGGIFAELTKLSPEDAILWQGLGLAHLALGQAAKAQEALNIAVGLRQSSWKAHNALGIILNHLRQPLKAVVHFDQAIKYGPKLAQLYNNRGISYMISGRIGKAEQDFRQAISISPKLKLAHNNLALLMAKRGQYEKAYRSFAKGTGPAQAHNNLGVIMAWRGRSQEAARQFDKALQANPRYYPKAGNHLDQIKGYLAPMKVTNLKSFAPTAQAPQAAPQAAPKAAVKPRPQAKHSQGAGFNPLRRQAPRARARVQDSDDGFLDDLSEGMHRLARGGAPAPAQHGQSAVAVNHQARSQAQGSLWRGKIAPFAGE